MLNNRPQVAAYYFPNYHVDPRNEKTHGAGWTEWELVRHAHPRFPGHRQPRVPAWGYEDEADPQVMARKIGAAADHGLDAFIFDWYWYDGGPFLQRGLENGFLQAANRDRLRFALMWANHDWVDLHPMKRGSTPLLLYPAAVTRQTFDTVTDYVIEHYFRQPNYWKIDGCPYFSIYEFMRLAGSLGGAAATREALLEFRAKTRAAGFPDLHLNAVVWGIQILPGETAMQNPREMVAYFGVNSVTSYVWVHNVELNQFPETPYAAVLAKSESYWRETAATFAPTPYHPNVTMGWDSSPRTCQSDVFAPVGYPFSACMGGNTPAAFREALDRARRFLDTRPPAERILTLNAWNEWTEGSYLEPDTEYGLGYLEAIRDVFGKRG